MLLAAAPTKDGYTFLKWKVLEDSGNWTANTEYAAGQTIDAGMYGDVTLVAQWSKDYYVLSKDWFNTLHNVITDKAKIETIQFKNITTKDDSWVGQLHVGEASDDLVYLSIKAATRLTRLFRWNYLLSCATIYSYCLWEPILRRQQRSFLRKICRIRSCCR